MQEGRSGNALTLRFGGPTFTSPYPVVNINVSEMGDELNVKIKGEYNGHTIPGSIPSTV